MALHLLKLSVGSESIRDLEEWIEERLAQRRKAKEPLEHIHRTRMVPKRIDELLDGGSIFWVIKGQIAARQKLIAVRPFTDKEGVSRCQFVMEPPLIPVMPRPFRAFQGWRYLRVEDAPPDIASGARGLADMPEELRRELRELGLL